MNKDQIAQIRARLLKAIPSDPTLVSEPADRIQKAAKNRPVLTVLCEYSQAQKMRRLVILPPPTWTEREARWAEEALAKISDLSARPGPEAALGLACFGVLRDDFDAALSLLAKTAEPVDQTWPAPDGAEPSKAAIPHPQAAGLVGELTAEPPKNFKSKAKKVKAAPLESLDEIDDTELDEQTLADLEALKREIDGLKK